MLGKTSEEALSSLDRSKNNPNDLLDQAATIIHATYDEQTHSYSHDPSSSSTNGFREAWVLKWILKKINESLKAEVHNDKTAALRFLVLSGKTWSLLLYLFSCIPARNLTDVLLERNFTNLLTQAGSRLLAISREDHSKASSSHTHHNRTEPPRKRRKLSASPDPTHHEINSTLDLSALPLSKFLQVCHAWGQTVLPSRQSITPNGRTAAIAWTGSVKDAAELVSCVLKGVNTVTEISADDSVTPITSAVTLMWLSLWQDFSNSSNSVDKPTVSKTFNETLLNPCLDLYYSLGKNSGSQLVAVRKGLERQVALYTVLPLRSIFNAHHKEAWVRANAVLSWNNIEPFYDSLRKQLGASLQIEENAGAVVEALQQTWYSTSLLSIASRLFPKDYMRRKYEQPFLEALFLGLIHLTYPWEMPRMEQDSSLVLQPINSDFSPTFIRGMWPLDLLESLKEHRVDLSANAFLYLASSLFLWRAQPLPLSLLRLVTNLNPDAFVTRSKEPNVAACFDTLLNKISGIERLQADEFPIVVKGCIFPLMDAFARNQEFNTFTEKWLINIQEAFRSRTNDSQPVREISGVRLWDDEDVLQHLTTICQDRNMMSFTQSLMESVINDLTTINERIGPTTDIFAKLAILENGLKGNGSDVLAVRGSRELFEEMTDLLAGALGQQNDYQGERWRLWSVLGLLKRLDVTFGRFDAISQTLNETKDSFRTTRKSSFEKLRPSQRNALLAEQHGIFSLVISHCANDSHTEQAADDLVQNALHREIDDLVDMLSDLQHARDPVARSSETSDVDLLWDGRLVNLLNIQQLVEGCLGCILQDPWAIRPESVAAQKLWSAIGSLRPPMCVGLSTQKPRTLGRLVEILIATCGIEKVYDSKSNVQDDATVSEDNLPALSIYQMNRRQRKQTADMVLKRLLTDEFLSDTELSACLAQLESLESLSPILISLPENFDTFTVICGKHIPNGSSAVVCQRAITNIFDSMWLGLMRMEKKRKTLSHIWSWVRQSLATSKQTNPTLRIVLVVNIINKFSTHTEEVKSIADENVIKETKSSFVDQILSLLKRTGPESNLSEFALKVVLRNLSKSEFAGTTLEPSISLNENHEHSKLLPSELMELETHFYRSSPDTEKSWKYLKKHFVNALSTEKHTSQKYLETISFGARVFTAPLNTLQKLHWLENKHQPHGQVEESLLVFLKSTIVSDILETDLKLAPSAAVALGRIATLENDHCSQTVIGRVFHLEVSMLILKSYPGIVNQSMIDTLLENLAMWSSNDLKIDPEVQSEDLLHDSEGAVAIFNRLVTILGVLLTKYRRRLTGRSHLLLPVLQNFLRCFFFTSSQAYMYQNTANWRQKQAFRTSLPSWLTGTLPSSSASKFSRVLSSLCNPTTASARSAHRTHHKSGSAMALNDETKKARRIAAQYMQYLIMEYARCSLDGVIQPQVKESLIPGLYSVLDAIDKDLMRAMNAAMDPSSRAIFKGLYDDWVKYGKWDQS